MRYRLKLLPHLEGEAALYLNHSQDPDVLPYVIEMTAGEKQVTILSGSGLNEMETDALRDMAEAFYPDMPVIVTNYPIDMHQAEIEAEGIDWKRVAKRLFAENQELKRRAAS